jgi:RND family efflux transporter MFP subunit
MKKTILSVLLVACFNATAATIALTPAQQASLGISVVPVAPADQAVSRPYPAQIRVPNDQLRVIATPEAGVIEALLVAEGEPVTQGQPLARILSPGLLMLQRDYLEALSGRELAADALGRDRKLLDEGIIAERRYLESRAAHQQQSAAAAQRRQALVLAGMDETSLKQLEKQRQLGSSLVVRAPLDGVVLEQLATAGQRVDSAAPLYQVGNLTPLWVEVHVPLEAARTVSAGDPVQLVREGISGKVITVGRMVHGTDQGVLVRAELADGKADLRPGQFVEVRLSGAGGAALRAPAAALARNAGKAYVFVQVMDGFEPVEVQVLASEGEDALLSATLPDDARVVSHGTAAVKAAWLGGGE